MNARTDVVVNESFGAHSQVALVETAATAGAARAKALVEARYIMALRRPRNWDQVRQDILEECRRPSFAHNKSAFYLKPIGDGIEGLGIRFAEVALRCMTNVTIETTTTYEDAMKEIVNVEVTDLEANVPYAMDIPISKTVERKKPNDDGSYISVRKNSWGKDVYTVIGSDEDLLNKRGALISKALRTLALRLIPGDIQYEAEQIIKDIRQDEAARDPGAERKKIVDAFGDLNVKATDLTEYLGHPLDNCSPQELVNLRGIYGAIRDGEATWTQVVENNSETKPKSKGGDSPGLPAYPAEKFATDLPKWQKGIKDGKFTVDELLAKLGTKNALTPAQISTIRGGGVSAEAIAAMVERGAKGDISIDDLCKHLGVEKLEGLTAAQLAKCEAFIADPAGEAK